MAEVTICRDLGAQENRICLYFSSIYLPATMRWWDWIPWSSFFERWVLSQLFHSLLSPLSRGSLFPLHFLPLDWYHLHIWGCWYFSQQSVLGWVIYQFLCFWGIAVHEFSTVQRTCAPNSHIVQSINELYFYILLVMN